MTVYFIGAGPGAPDLITLRGRDRIAACPVVLYAGSLVPAEVVAFAPEGAKVMDTAPMTLDEIIAEIEAAHAAGHDVARVHSGDPSLYGAIAEQIRRLRALGIPFEIVPGVPAYAAAAAALESELTLPEVLFVASAYAVISLGSAAWAVAALVSLAGTAIRRSLGAKTSSPADSGSTGSTSATSRAGSRPSCGDTAAAGCLPGFRASGWPSLVSTPADLSRS